MIGIPIWGSLFLSYCKFLDRKFCRQYNKLLSRLSETNISCYGRALFCSSSENPFLRMWLLHTCTVLQTVRKPKLSYYAYGVRQAQLHMDSIVICIITKLIFHNFKSSESSWNLEVQKWGKTVLKIHFLTFNNPWSHLIAIDWLIPRCLLGNTQSKSRKGLAGTWGINRNSWLNFEV